MAVRAAEEAKGERRTTSPCCVDVQEVMREVEGAPLAQQHALLAALADPTRLKMVHLLCRTGELCVCDFTPAFDLGQPTVSHHLRVLREAGIVTSRKAGQWVYYSVNHPALKAFVGSLLELL
jgi:ArsR family transcriptional regulator, arsenate/arsenite/antimonite-responsive transcriptional repressor